jgi:hypothetical protein
MVARDHPGFLSLSPTRTVERMCNTVDSNQEQKELDAIALQAGGWQVRRSTCLLSASIYDLISSRLQSFREKEKPCCPGVAWGILVAKNRLSFQAP